MIIQISSGQGPAECELAVGKFYDVLKKEYPDIKEITSHMSRFSGCYTSIMFETGHDLSGLEGTIQWICQSPFRPNHKRKNWFIDVSIIPEQKIVCTDPSIRFERFHCGGKGGQNVNKVETGVRLIHIPTGITVTSTSERSQILNKKTLDEAPFAYRGIREIMDVIGETVKIEKVITPVYNFKADGN